MAVRQVDPMAELTSSFQLLLKNWTLAAPPLAVGLVVLVLVLVMGGASLLAMMGGAGMMAGNNSDAGAGAMAAGLGALFGTLGLAVLVGAVLGVIANAATCSAADDAWNGRTINLGASVSRALGMFLNLLVFIVIVGLACGIVAITFVGPLVVAVLMMYGLPAIVIGGRSGIDAISDSFQMVTKNFGPSAMAFLGLIAAFVVVGIVNVIVGHIPFIGTLISLVLGALVSAFVAVVTVRFYTLLRGSGGVMITTPAPPPMAPPAAS
jgi:hypothetical protein